MSGSGASAAAVIDRIELPDGRSLVVRVASEADVASVLDLYSTLSATDLHRRFFCAFRPSEEWCRSWMTVGDRGGFAVVVEAFDTSDDVRPGAGRIIADAGYALRTDGDGDLAITIADEWRGWLGAYLLDVLAARAAADGVENLQAEVLLENEGMLALLRHRGAVVHEHDAGQMRCSISTSGGVASWPSADGRPRVLVEIPGARWSGEAAARRAGVDVVMCGGPTRRHGECPVLHEGSCPLATEADVVVVALEPDDPTTAPLIEGHVGRHPEVPVVVRSPADRSLPPLCRRVESFDAGVVGDVVDLAIERARRRAPE